MGRRILIHISAASLILASFCMVVASGLLPSASVQKIDHALAERLIGQESEKINVIVTINGMDVPDLDGLDIKYRYRLIHGLAGEATPKAIKKMAESDFVKGIYLDGSAQVSAPNENSSSGDYISPSRIINADKLWEKGIDGRGINVAVIDSGIDKNHPDLIGRVIAEKNFLADEITTDDLLGHGTMVAGIIAGSGAASNGKYKGIAPAASLISVKVIDSKGDGKVSDIIAGIEWAIYNGADVLSLSLGGINLGETNPPITMAADSAADFGVVVCVAAGNRNSTDSKGQVAETSSAQAGDSKYAIDLSQDHDSKDKNVLIYVPIPIVLALPPGLIDSPGDGVKVITLGAADNNGHLASFSGSGPTRDDRIKPDVVAPGVDIISIVPAGLKRPENVDQYYARESGTSLSTPIAAGLSALLLQANGNLTPAGVKAAMTRGALKLKNTLGEEYEEYYQGAGLLNAQRSYQMLGNDLCGVIPDQWNAGRWAYLPAGKGVYVGLDTGADRPQKKIYALAPGDEDWNLRFVFFSNQEIENLRTSVRGAISNWVSLQALPETILANDQKVFGASITVPEDASPGIYNGSIDISKDRKNILSIPIRVVVAESFNITGGLGSKTGSLKGNEWDYFYLDIMPGTSEFNASLQWQENANLDLFLLSPTSEYYAGDKNSQQEMKTIRGPSIGRWLLAVHSENSSVTVNYSLNVERSRIETVPNRWNLESALPGTSAKTQFMVKNFGPPLHNLSYFGVIENSTIQEFEGDVGLKETWNKTLIVTEWTKMISAQLSTVGGSNRSEVALVLENPEGIAKEENAALGSGDIGPVDIYNPDVGNWTLKVYGYNVPESGQPFRVTVKEYAEEEWSWIKTKGPEQLESDSNGTLEADITIPLETSLPRLDGIIKITSGDQTIQIPISVVVNGSNLRGLTLAKVIDANNDGHFDYLNMDFGLNVTAPGNFRLEGVLTDCMGSRIANIDRRFRVEKSSNITVNVNGSDIWRKGKCGPLEVRNLILYDEHGTFIEMFKKNITIERDPQEFQPPAAYFLDSFVNETTSNKIRIGVNLSVIKPGNYQLSGTIVDDRGETLGENVVESKLMPGNATLVLEYNPIEFMILGEVSQVHLIDLVLSQEANELERKDWAWSSEDLDPKGFESGAAAKKTNIVAGLNGSDIIGNDMSAGTFRIGR
jgi:subtilisin family serine protease